MSPLSVTAIIPVYNGVRYLRETFDSLLAQTRRPDEVILIDDGSTDESPSLLQELVSTHGATVPIRVITQVNGGQSRARNVAVEAATSELIAFLDQDDLWHPRHLEALAAPFDDDSSLGWAYSDFDEIDAAGLLITRGFIATHRLEHPKSTLHQILGSDLMVLPSASVIRRSTYRDVGGFDEELSGYEDDELFIRVFRARWSTEYLNTPLTLFRTHSGSSSARRSFRESRMKFLDKLSAQIPDDIRMNRLYVSELLVPRLVEGTIAEYASAITLHQDDEARAIVVDLRRMIGASTTTGRGRVGMSILARPGLTRVLLRVHRSLPGRMRPRLHVQLRLRG